MILNLIPQLPKNYRLALLKNEFGDLAIDSQLASSAAISGVQELLNGCICCNLVGQLGDALETLRRDVAPDRIIIETSGSAFPATLAMEVNRLGRELAYYVLDGVVAVIDVENWKGYEDTSYTAKLQARYTDLIVFNKWELVSERKYECCLDKVGDLDLPVATVKSDKGWVDQDLLIGLDNAFAKIRMLELEEHHQREKTHSHASDHQNEVEVLSIALSPADGSMGNLDLDALHQLLKTAPKEEIYRIKAIFTASHAPLSENDSPAMPLSDSGQAAGKYILNWAFGRWSYTPVNSNLNDKDHAVLRMTVILARYEAEKWRARIESGGLLELQDSSHKGFLQIERKV